MSDFHSKSTVRARKPHSCEECGKKIEPRQEYARVAGVYEGDFYRVDFCLKCDRLWALYYERRHDGCNDPIPFGELRWAIRETHVEDVLCLVRRRWEKEEVAHAG